MAKYLTTGAHEGLERAERRSGKPLDLNPCLAIAHKFYAQLEVDLGRCGDAMTRPTSPAQEVADPEVFAGMDDNPYIVALSLAEVGRKDEALPALRALQKWDSVSVDHERNIDSDQKDRWVGFCCICSRR